MTSALERRLTRLEQTARVSDADDAALAELVGRLKPVEREQRLLGIRHYTKAAQDPAARAALDEALFLLRAGTEPLS